MNPPHPLRCRCGTLRGQVASPGVASRAVCYCKDCQAYAHHLDRVAEVLDPTGGTDIVATLPEHVSLTQGADQLACVSLTDRGLLRWYARCCHTPIGNTPRDTRTPYVGLVHSCLHDPAQTLDQSFGPVGMRLNVDSAKGKTPATGLWRKLATIAHLMKAMVPARLAGRTGSPFFDAGSGRPVAAPHVLTEAELRRAMAAV